MSDVAPIPQFTCKTCVFHKPNKECRRHAPGTNSEEENLPVVWDRTKDHQRCGNWSDDPRKLVPCAICEHWYVPEGGLNPAYKQGLGDDWWPKAGLCTMAAPGPNFREGRDTFWGVTHATKGDCGDGKPPEESKEETTEPITE